MLAHALLSSPAMAVGTPSPDCQLQKSWHPHQVLYCPSVLHSGLSAALRYCIRPSSCAHRPATLQPRLTVPPTEIWPRTGDHVPSLSSQKAPSNPNQLSSWFRPNTLRQTPAGRQAARQAVDHPLQAPAAARQRGAGRRMEAGNPSNHLHQLETLRQACGGSSSSPTLPEMDASTMWEESEMSARSERAHS